MELIALEYGSRNAQMIPSDRVFLDLQNPRVPQPFATEDEAIQWLCDNEDVLILARDIREIGPNPLELVAVMKKAANAYVALEGNRRVCAILLLNDPDRAPASYRERFKALSEGWVNVDELFCVEFPNRRSVQVWLDRIHGGRDDGRGRSPWDADVRARRTHSSSSRANRLPLALLDYGQANGLISETDRQKKLAIVGRFSSNQVFKNLLGINSRGDDFETSLPKEDFDELLGELLADIVNRGFKAHQFDRDAVVRYVNEELSEVEVSGERGEPWSLQRRKSRSSRSGDPSRPTPPSKLPLSKDLQDGLAHLGNFKLRKLFYSLTKLSAKDHSPLLFVGLWSLVECLTALDGRVPNTDFVSYLNAQKLERMGFGDKKKTASMREALGRISKFGNGTKHDGEAAGFNYEQLINDFQVIEKLLKKLVEDCMGSASR